MHQGDVFLSRDGALWIVSRADFGSQAGQFGILVDNGNVAHRWGGTVDPDDVVQVLVPVTERDAVELARDQLGARLIERRTG